MLSADGRVAQGSREVEGAWHPVSTMNLISFIDSEAGVPLPLVSPSLQSAASPAGVVHVNGPCHVLGVCHVLISLLYPYRVNFDMTRRLRRSDYFVRSS